eukprot:3193519-Prymnesium_polylepis.1
MQSSEQLDFISAETCSSVESEVFSSNLWRPFKYDASDATAIGLCKIKELHGMLEFAESFRIVSIGLPNPRPSKPIPYQPSTSAPTTSASASTTIPIADTSLPIATTSAASTSTDSPLRDPWICTLIDGCTLRTNHVGCCQVQMDSPRKRGKLPITDGPKRQKKS